MELAIACTIFGFLVFLWSFLWKSRKVNANTPPEASGAWPLLGHLPLLGGPQPAYITLGDMADKYGPLFTIKLGINRTLVVNSWEMAKECLTTNDKVFANRPKYLAAELLGYNFAMIGFSPYGPYWRQVRKMATLELLSNHRLEMLKNVRESEVKASIKEINDLWNKNNRSLGKTKWARVEMRRWFGDINLNIIFRMVVGQRFVGGPSPSEMDEESERWRRAVRDVFKLSGEYVVSDALPFLRWLDLGGHEKAMKRTAKELDDVLERWLKQHKQKRISGSGEVSDFMDMMLSVLHDAEDQSSSSYDSDTIIKATCLALILGGTDTTMVSLTWALSMLLNNREILKKAQDELDQQVGRERHVKESDMNNLIYLQAIIKETLRLYPSAPLSLPHESMEDCKVGGYHVPAGTRLIVNIGKIQRDPRVWSDPNQFQPERFFTSTCKDLDVRGHNFELIPFGSGRRVCPGISFALQVMQLILANLLHAFEITTPADEEVDLGETSGLTNMKATPLEVILTPRLSVDS